MYFRLYIGKYYFFIINANGINYYRILIFNDSVILFIVLWIKVSFNGVFMRGINLDSMVFLNKIIGL